MSDDTDDELEGIEIKSRADAEEEKKAPKRRGRPAKPKLTAIEGGKKKVDAKSGDLPEIPANKKDDDGLAQRLAQGVTINLLSSLFGNHRNTIENRLKGIQPKGLRGNSHVYDFVEAVKAIAEPAVREIVEEEMKAKRRSSPAAPVEMGKEYWEEQNLKMKFALESGQLWHRERVVTSIAKIIKPIKIFLMSLEDEVESARRDDIKISDLGRARLVQIHAEMKKIATEDPLRAYRSDYAETEGDDEDDPDVGDGDD